MGVFGSIVQALMLSVFYTLEYLFLGCCVAFKFVRDNHPRRKALLLEEVAEELLGRFGVLSALHQDVQYIAFLVYRSRG